MLQLSVRSAVILAVAWLVSRLLTRASAATRHLVWHTAILAVLAAPLVILLVPKMPVTLPHGVQQLSTQLTSRVAGVTRYVPNPASSLAVETTRHMSTRASSAVIPPSDPGVDTDLGGVLAALWFAGSVGLALWFATGWLLAARQVWRAAPAPAAWLADLDELRRKLRVTADVGLGALPKHASPIAVGFFRSTILLPSTAASWSDDRRRAVLLHELAHIKRGDCRIQAFAQAACALYWFNPLVWTAFRTLRTERERACDDEVLRTGTLASTYAAHLLEIARDLRPTFGPRTALAMARPSELEGRVLAVLATERARVPVAASRWLVTSSLAVTTAVALSVTPLAHTTFPPLPAPSSLAPRYLSSAEPAVGERLEAHRLQAAASATIADSQDPDARERAVLELAATASDTAIPALVRALDDDSSQVREKAAFALGLLSTADVIEPLIEALRDPDAQVREKAAMGLALRRSSRSVDALIEAAVDADSQVREKVAMALGTSGDPRAAAVLTRALNDPDSQVREKAVLGLRLLSTAQPGDAMSEGVRGGLRELVRGLLNLTR